MLLTNNLKDFFCKNMWKNISWNISANNFGIVQELDRTFPLTRPRKILGNFLPFFDGRATERLNTIRPHGRRGNFYPPLTGRQRETEMGETNFW